MRQHGLQLNLAESTLVVDIFFFAEPVFFVYVFFSEILVSLLIHCVINMEAHGQG